MKHPVTNLAHLPPHLREVCAILASGIVRTRIVEPEYTAPSLGVAGEISLHFQPEQSVHANSQPGRDP